MQKLQFSLRRWYRLWKRRSPATLPFGCIWLSLLPGWQVRLFKFQCKYSNAVLPKVDCDVLQFELSIAAMRAVHCWHWSCPLLPLEVSKGPLYASVMHHVRVLYAVPP